MVIEITPEMLFAGVLIVEDWREIEDARALARRVYIAMAELDPQRGLVPVPLIEVEG